MKNELAAGDRFFDAKLGWGQGGGVAGNGVRRDDRAGLEAFGGGAESGPPTGAGFFEEEEFGAILGADKAGGDDFGVVENKEVGGGEKGGEVADGEIGEFAGGAAEEKESGGVAGLGGGGGDSVVGNSEGEQMVKSRGGHGMI